MQQEMQAGLLSGSPPSPDRQGEAPDPLDAVAVIEQARNDAGVEAESAPAGDKVTVEVTVDSGAARDQPGESDGYGEFAWPDGFTADRAALARFVPVAKKLGLGKEAAQELASLYAELEKAKNASQAEFVEKNNAQWLREIQNHPEFGKHNLERTAQGVAALLNRYGSPLLTAQMRQMNIQNWPEMFYFLARLAQANAEDVSPSSAGGQMDEATTARMLFPDMK